MKPVHFKKLRSGYTTGACAAAAAKGATLLLLEQKTVRDVTIGLPGGGSATFQLHGQAFNSEIASCFVIKDAGDDPDITNGAELHAAVSLSPHEGEGIVQIAGGIGIGKMTKPGLAVAPGEWAINPVPRRMIEQAIREAFSLLPAPQPPVAAKVTISIPDGEERAKKTLNARLGIIGGLSILGTTGIVKPISAKAWTDTIDAALDVARACACPTVVLSTGRTSEMAAQRAYWNRGTGTRNQGPGTGERGPGSRDNRMILPVPDPTSHVPVFLPVPGPRSHVPSLPEEAYIMMGDHVAYALQACQKRGFHHPIVACQFAKLLKIACGHPNTHAAASELDLATLRTWAEQAHLAPELVQMISGANTAREIAVTSRFDPTLTGLVSRMAEQAAATHAPGIMAGFLLCGYDGVVHQT
ncbi:MAG: cobalt-precorrin-6A synthase [Geobacteraceae bacterium GWB2_52_12]|nr:MAG: cobalt-precorrin-6A synthase [Geobacteraceae bacterium GWB2_52_12]